MTFNPLASTSTDVLVVGAGPAGLATAVSALRHGAQVLVVERRAGTSTIPRATGISTRTMEIFRQWDLATAVRAGGIDCEPQVALGPTLAAEPAQVVPFSYPSMREALAVSPTYPLLCPQDHIEPLLVDEIRRLGGTVRFDTALTDLRTDTGYGVRAELGPGSPGPGPVRGRRRRPAQPGARRAGHRVASGWARWASSCRCCSGPTWPD